MKKTIVILGAAPILLAGCASDYQSGPDAFTLVRPMPQILIEGETAPTPTGVEFSERSSKTVVLPGPTNPAPGPAYVEPAPHEERARTDKVGTDASEDNSENVSTGDTNNDRPRTRPGPLPF